MKSFLPHVEHLPVYEPGRPIEDVAREQGWTDVEQILKLASNENLLGPSPKAVMAMQAAAGTMHVYPDGGTWALREKLASHTALTPDHILPGNGSNELIELLGHVFLEPGRNIVMAETAFVVYQLVATAFQAETIRVPMKDYTHDLDAMQSAITEDTRLLFVANPNNPTGTMVDPNRLLAFLDETPDHVLVVVDEAYVELVSQNLCPDVLSEIRNGRSNLMVLRTFSKAYGLAGLRLGYGMASPELVRLLNRVRQPFNVNAMAQTAALAALDDSEYVLASRELVQAGRVHFEALCRELRLEFVPSEANFMLIRVGDGRRVFEALQKRSVIVRPMNAYGLPEHVRVTYGTTDQNEVFAEALRNCHQEGLLS